MKRRTFINYLMAMFVAPVAAVKAMEKVKVSTIETPIGENPYGVKNIEEFDKMLEGIFRYGSSDKVVYIGPGFAEELEKLYLNTKYGRLTIIKNVKLGAYDCISMDREGSR